MTNKPQQDADRVNPSRRHDDSIEFYNRITSRLKLTQNDIDEFKAIWKKEFDEEISDEYARQKATELIRLCALLASPPPSRLVSKRRLSDTTLGRKGGTSRSPQRFSMGTAT